MTGLALLWLLGCPGPGDSGTLSDSVPTIDTGTAPIDTGTAPTDSPPVDPCDQGPAMIIGAGELVHQALSPGDEVPIIYGPQGGWHLWESLETFNTGQIGTIRAAITLGSTGAVVSETEVRVGLIQDPDVGCRRTYPGMIGYLDVSALADGTCDTPPELLGYRELCFALSLVDEYGVEVSDSVCALAVPSPEDGTEMDSDCWPS